MTEVGSDPRRDYPETVTLENGTAVSPRLMGPAGGERVERFARLLPADDLLVLRTDITHGDVVDQWMENLTTGRTVSVVAELAGETAGYTSLHREEVT